MALDARAAAARSLAGVLKGRSLSNVLPDFLDKVTARDRGLTSQLSYGTLRHLPRLQAILSQLLDKPLRSKDSDVTALLLVGLYQLENLRVPDHAAVAATVDATRALGKTWAKGLTNALLRRFLRERDQLLRNLDAPASLSHPTWLHDEILRQWPEAAASIFAANNQQPPMTLRVNTRHDSREHYLEKLAEAGLKASACTLSMEGITLAEPVDVALLPGFANGDISVQDEAAQLAASLLGAQPGHRVLDACAAPGGKACHVLELQPELEQMIACDIDQSRLQRVTENLERLQLEATLRCCDAATPGLFPTDNFDRILIDAPCSASGVIRRHPDIKVLRRVEDSKALSDRQRPILRALWPSLKPGGLMLYVTCSIFAEENSQVVADFLHETPGASLLRPSAPWGIEVSHGRQLLPSTGGPDGLFFALIRREN